MSFTHVRWAAKWRSVCPAALPGDGLLGEGDGVKTFRTRRECREWIEREYGYIKTRQDLRATPFGWRLPRAVRVKVTWEIVK